MWPTFGCLSVAPWILFAQMSWTMDTISVQNAGRNSSGTRVEIRDRAGLFGRGAGRRAGEALGRIRRTHHVTVVIETVASTDGDEVIDAAQQRAHSVKSEQLSILLAADGREVKVISPRQGPASRLSDKHREAIRRAFLDPLRMGDADLSLEQGIREIGLTLAARSRPKLGPREAMVPVTLLLALLSLRTVSRFRGWRRRLQRRSSSRAAPMDFLHLPLRGGVARS